MVKLFQRIGRLPFWAKTSDCLLSSPHNINPLGEEFRQEPSHVIAENIAYSKDALL